MFRRGVPGPGPVIRRAVLITGLVVHLPNEYSLHDHGAAAGHRNVCGMWNHEKVSNSASLASWRSNPGTKCT